MTTHPLYDFTITVAPPAGTAPSTHKVQGTSATDALSLHLYTIQNCELTHIDHVARNISEIKGVARASMNGTIYIAAPTNPKPVAPAPERDPKTGIQMWELEG